MASIRRALRSSVSSSYPPCPSGLLSHHSFLRVPFSTVVPQESNSSISKLEEEKGDISKRKDQMGSLYSLFSSPSVSGTETRVQKFPPRRRMGRSKLSEDSGVSGEDQCAEELMAEMSSLVGRLREDGYLKSSSFSPEMDFHGVVNNDFLRGLLMKAAESFGEHHQEIAKWLSGSSLKKVALSGCPCRERKTVFAAKRLRSFFFIQEDVICRGCPMKNSCKFVNQHVNREHKLLLPDVMRVLTAYACGYGDSHAMKSQDMRDSVRRSLKEVISLSS